MSDIRDYGVDLEVVTQGEETIQQVSGRLDLERARSHLRAEQD